MGLRRWIRERKGGRAHEPQDEASFLESLLGARDERIRSLGEYDQESYPPDLLALMKRRQAVADRLLEIDIADPEARIAAVPQLKQMLHTYPHPLVYELLILAFLDQGRYDEAKGVALAAHNRRDECARSPYPEIRGEIEHLRDWNPDEVERMRESEGGARPAEATPRE
jgi:hypothetical protein